MDQAKKSPSWTRLDTEGKKHVVAAYAAVAKAEKRYQEILGNPSFKFTFNPDNFGHPVHPNVIAEYKKDGYSRDASFYTKEVPDRVKELTGMVLAYISDFDNDTIIWWPLTAGLEKFCNDEIQKDTLQGLLKAMEFSHAPADSDVQSHWRFDPDGKLTFVWNCHAPHHHKGGYPVYSQQTWGTPFELFRTIADLNTLPSTPKKWGMNAIDELK